MTVEHPDIIHEVAHSEQISKICVHSHVLPWAL